MSSDPFITMRHVAEACGVAVSTVSKALRNDPSISEERSRSIQAAAQRLGYQPNPLVSALMAQVHHHRRRSDPHHLAWLDFWPAGGKPDAALSAKSLLRGARMRAEELGYGIEVYAVAAEAISLERLRSLLTTRGQWGILIPPVPTVAMRMALDMRGLTGVTIGTSLHHPVMHRVSPNHYQGGVLAWTTLRAKGFRRIGLALTPEMNERVERKWLGAFLACQQELTQRERVSPWLASAADPAALARWLARETPDAVLVAEDFPWQEAMRITGQPAGATTLAGLLRRAGAPGHDGLDHQPEQLGRVAVEMVVAQIHRNDRGSPTVPHTILIDAIWADAHPAGAGKAVS